MIKFNLPKKAICIIVLVTSVAMSSFDSSYASHYKNASKAKLQEIFHYITNTIHIEMNSIEFPATTSVRELTNSRDSLPSAVRSEIKNSEILSLLFYDGTKIKYDWRRNDVNEDTLLYGASMSKSVTSYLAGKAYCAGNLKSLQDPLVNYIPELEGTFYENVKLIESLNMAAGDGKLYSGGPGGQENWNKYVNPVWYYEQSVLEAIHNLKNRKPPKKKKFSYRNANTDLIAMAMVNSAPNGFEKFVHEALVEPAGLKYLTEYKTDKAKNPNAAGLFFATRTDWLRIALKIAEDFKSPHCIGEYLRSSVSDYVLTREKPCSRYGKFFWHKCSPSSLNDIRLRGHGGKRIIIDRDQKRILVIHSIVNNYDEIRIIRKLFKNAHN